MQGYIEKSPHLRRLRAGQPDGRHTYKVGVIGLGRQAILDHIPGIEASANAELAAICDTNIETLSEQRTRTGVPGYRDFNDMFAKVHLDFVIVCVPHDVGRMAIEAAAANGIHVLKEKPFATSMTDALTLVEACTRSDIHLMVTLQRRFNPVYTSFMQLADQIGTPFIIDARYTLHIPDPSDGWRGKRTKAGGGCVIDMGYHLIDMLIWYFGCPSRVLANISTVARPDRQYDAEDTALVQFSYADGLYGSLLLSRFIGPKQEQILLVGSKGMVHLERGRIRRLTNDGAVVESLSREQAWPSAATCQIDYFCRVIEGDRPNVSGPSQHLEHMRFIEGCYESATTNRYVDLEESA